MVRDMNEFEAIVEKQRAYFLTQATKPYAFRMERLRALLGWIEGHEDDILWALAARIWARAIMRDT